MEAAEKVCTKFNITIVFKKNLDKDMVRKDIIKQTFKDYKITIFDVPGLLVIDFKKNNGQANFQKRRLAINVPVKNQEDTDKLIEFISFASKNLLEAIPPTEVSAFGFNISGYYKSVEFDYNNYLLDVFCDGREKLSEKIGSKVIKVSPAFSFEKEDAVYNISLTPNKRSNTVDTFDQLHFHCNIHFANSSPLEINDINAYFLTYLEYYERIMESL